MSKVIPIRTQAGHAFLHVKRFEGNARIHLDHLVNFIELEAEVERATNVLTLELKARVAGKTYDVKAVEFYPTAWEHVKGEWFPTFCRWLHVEMRTDVTTLEASAYYPTVHIPAHKAFVQVTLSQKNHANAK